MIQDWEQGVDLEVPGVWRGLPDHVYHGPLMKWHLNSSTLKKVYQESPRQVKNAWEAPSTSGLPRAMNGPGVGWNLLHGQALHVALGQPHLIDNVVDLGSKPVKGEVLKVANDSFNSGKIPLKNRLYKQTMRVYDGWENDPYSVEAKASLGACDEFELTIIWEEERYGVKQLCKARMDAWTPGLLVDIKTGMVKQQDMQGKLNNLCYDLQFSFYRRALEAGGLGSQEETLVEVVTCTTDWCFEVDCWVIEEEVLHYGDMKTEECLDKWMKCKSKDEWPTAQGGQKHSLGYRTWDRRTLEEKYPLFPQALS